MLHIHYDASLNIAQRFRGFRHRGQQKNSAAETSSRGEN